MSTTTPNFNLIKPELSDAADITAMNLNWDIIDENLGKGKGNGNILVNATSSDGTTYTATSEDITSLFVGLRITIIPNRNSAALTPTLDINGLGAKNIIMPIDGVNSSMATNAAKLPTWVGANQPMEIVYDGTRWKSEVRAQSAQYMYGQVAIAGGGTGADTAEEALNNLGAAPIASPTFTGTPTTEAGTDYTTKKLRNVLFGTSAPTYETQWSNGDIFIVYTP